MNESQRAMVAASLATMSHGGDRKSQDANLHVDRQKAADMLQVSPRSVATAAKIEREAPAEVAEAVSVAAAPAEQIKEAAR